MEEEFEEGEVWDVAREKKDCNSPKIRKQKEESSSSSNFIGEKSRHSKPVSIPNWSKNDRINCEEEEEEDNLPPHEWIARKMARSQISSSSVCEGAGRTLKGRDQRKVRETVLSKTGFLE